MQRLCIFHLLSLIVGSGEDEVIWDEAPFLCFKANATGKAKRYPAWQISFRAYTDNPDEWIDEYHIRSMVEAVFSSIKRCWGPDIKSIKGWLKRRELAIKVLAYNIKRVLYIERAEDLGIPLWVSCQ